jgi:hypothetical protein
MPPDFYLIVSAILIGIGGTAYFRARHRRDEQRRQRTLRTVPLRRIGETAVGERVRIRGVVERVVELRRVRGLLVGDGSGAVLVYAGGAALHPTRPPARGDAVTVVGNGRPIDRVLDGDAGGARLVFAGGEACPLYIVAGEV